MTHTTRLTHKSVIGLLLAALGAAAFAVWHFTRVEELTPPAPDALRPDAPPPDPRLVFDTPYRNVKPAVRYLGGAACSNCHRQIAATYRAHPMGRSAESLAQATSIEKYPPGETTFSAGPFDFKSEKTAEGMNHRIRLRAPSPVPVPDVVLPIQIAIGSGTRGRSYLTVDRGCVWQSPVSWFGPDERWDLSPGFRLGRATRRSIAQACLFCHVDRVEPAPGAENQFREPLFAHHAAIGCERCHGPGEVHVAERSSDPNGPAPDTSIVNPRHLSPALQLAICEQCHLQGEERVTRRGRDLFEFRPGLPFDRFVSVYVRHPGIAEANRSVGQFEQMEQSRCFEQSGGRLTCTSCHDPHFAPPPAARAAHYRQKCLACHQEPGPKACALPRPDREPKQDSCVACHMPKAPSANITHASVTDHRVPRTPAPASAARGLPFGAAPLVRFRSGAPLSPEELKRDLGIALARFGEKAVAKAVTDREELHWVTIDRLKTALALWPGDAEAWGALAVARSGRGEAAEKLKAATAAAELAPNSEPALLALTEAATAAGEYDLATEAAGKRIWLNPLSSDPLTARAFVYLRRGDWARAEADSRAALRINPFHAESRLYLAICRHHSGDPETGLREARTAAQLEPDPRDKAFLMNWYQQATR